MCLFCATDCPILEANAKSKGRHLFDVIIAKTAHFRKTEKVIKSDTFLKSRRLEKFTGACFAQIGPLVKMLSNFKVGAC